MRRKFFVFYATNPSNYRCHVEMELSRRAIGGHQWLTLTMQAAGDSFVHGRSSIFALVPITTIPGGARSSVIWRLKDLLNYLDSAVGLLCLLSTLIEFAPDRFFALARWSNAAAHARVALDAPHSVSQPKRDVCFQRGRGDQGAGTVGVSAADPPRRAGTGHRWRP
jgi:hypothetical protein